MRPYKEDCPFCNMSLPFKPIELSIREEEMQKLYKYHLAGHPELVTAKQEDKVVFLLDGKAKELFQKELDSHFGRIFEMLNCYEVDARNITNGITYLDSSDAERLAKNIIHSIKENI